MIRLLLLLLALTASVSADTLRIEKTDRVGRKIENEFFIADLSKRVVLGKEEDSGSLRALTYKPFDVTLLRTLKEALTPGSQRAAPRMHWAPNLQRVGASGYMGIATWHPVQTFREEEKDGVYTHRREGYIPDYPEVKMEAEYRFMPGVPYFLFWSRVNVEKPLVVTLVRNNEMTMGPFFTHVAWPGRDGARHLTTFAERHAILKQEPIPYDAPWVAFVNLDKGYGFGFLNIELKQSRTINPGIGISDGADDGKYWSRRLIGGETPLKPGDFWEERNAYVLFRASKDKPLDEFFARETEIRSTFRQR